MKRKRVSFLITSGNFDIFFLQETKLSCFDDIVAKSFCGSSDAGWFVPHSRGASGGLAIFWRKHFVIVNHSFIGNGFIGINVSWNGDIYNLVNICFQQRYGEEGFMKFIDR